MEFTHLPIIDWQLSTKLAGNKKEVAADMLDLLIKNLHQEITAIKQFHFEKNYQELLRRVHKLHGGLCYSGLPRLKTIVSHLETELKNDKKLSLPALLKILDNEIHLLFEHYSSLAI